MKKIQAVYVSLTVTTLAVIAGCASSHFHSTRNPADEGFEAMKANYDKLYPLYAIECASSKFDQIGETPGGPYGHTFMYLKGACRDKTANFPKIKVCDNADLSNPESGVGLALDKTFQDTRFIASDGYNFLINGDVASNAPVDKAAIKAAVDKLVADGDTKGVILHKKYMDQKTDPKVNKIDVNMSDDEWIGYQVVGSSFAIDFARNLGCIAVPINPAMLQAAVDYTNEQNEPFTSKRKKFNWNPVSDQCVQFVHNVFASMGIGEEMITSSGKNFLVRAMLQARDFASFLLPFVPQVMPGPVNDLIQKEEIVDSGKIYTLQEAYNNSKVKANFNKFKRLAMTDGALVYLHPAHDTDNTVFNVDSALKAADIPLIPVNAHEFKKITEMASPKMIQDNIVTFQKKLQDTITSMDIEGRSIDNPEYCDFAAVQNKTPDSADFKGFCKDYVKYLTDSKADVVDHLGKLATM